MAVNDRVQLRPGQTYACKRCNSQLPRQHIEVQPKNVRQVRSDAPKALERVVSKCLEKDPNRRFQTPLDLVDALAQAVPQIAQAQQPPPQAAPPKREVPREAAPKRGPSHRRAAKQAERAEPSASASPRPASRGSSAVRRFIVGAVVIGLVALIGARVLSDVWQPPSREGEPQEPVAEAASLPPGGAAAQPPIAPAAQLPAVAAVQSSVVAAVSPAGVVPQQVVWQPPSSLGGAAGSALLVSDSSWKVSGEQQPGWTDGGFDDSSWVDAQAPWAYWDHDDLSPAQPMWHPGGHDNDLTWYFFRKSFSIPSLAAVTGAKLTIQVDDDYVVYVNGHEVARDETGFTDPASTYDVLPFLASGENVVAIQAIDAGGNEGVNVWMEIAPDTALDQEQDPAGKLILASAILSASYDAMQTIDSFHFEGLGAALFQNGEGSNETMGWEFTGDFLAPDRTQGDLLGSTSDIRSQVQVISVGDKTYVQDVESGQWREDAGRRIPVPHATLELDPSLIEDLVYVGRETLDGRPVYHLQGTAPLHVLGGLDAQDRGGRLQVEYWIDAKVRDARLLRVAFKGVTDAAMGTFLWTINYSDFGKSVEINIPIVAATAPGTGPGQTAPAAPNAQVSPSTPSKTKSQDGDWTITGEESYQDTIITVSGRVIITGSGALRLEDSWLVFDKGVPRKEAIDVQGGTLSLKDSAMWLQEAGSASEEDQLTISTAGGTVSLQGVQVPHSFILEARDSTVQIVGSSLEAPQTTVEVVGGDLLVENSKIFKLRLLDGTHNVVDSKLERIDFSPASELTVLDSQVSVLTVILPHEGQFLLKHLDGSADAAYQIGDRGGDGAANLTLVRSPVAEWSVIVNGGLVTIENSSIGYLLSQNGSKVVVDSSTVRSWDIRDRAEVIASRVNYLNFDSNAVAPVSVSLLQTEVGTLRAAAPGSTGVLDVDIFCSECRIDQAIELSGSDLSIEGDAEILASPANVSWESSHIRRSYRVVLSDAAGGPIAGAAISLIESGTPPLVTVTPIEQAITDESGQAVFALDFFDGDWSKQYQLTATVGNLKVEETLGLFSTSPVLLSVNGATAAPESPPSAQLSPGNECYDARSDDDSVELISISPAPGSTLLKGTTAQVVAAVRYILDSHNLGRVMLWHGLPPNEDGSPGGRAVFAELEVSKGRGIIIVSGDFEVPDLSEIDIRLSLDPTGTVFQAAGFDCWVSIASVSAGDYPISDAPAVEPVAGSPAVEGSGIHVRAHIDGRSLLMISGNSAHWLHLENAAPGRERGATFVTVINGTEWAPQWPDRPDPENRGCRCVSSKFLSPDPLLPAAEMLVGINIIEARGDVLLLQQPTKQNEYTLIVEFNDGPGGSDWYEVRIVPGSSADPTTSSGLTMGATISGTITDAGTGLGISNIHVDADPVREGGPNFHGDTNGGGQYTMTGVVPGLYRLNVGSNGSGYIKEYYDNQLSPDDANLVVVLGSETIEGIDFALNQGATISGRITDVSTGLPLSNIDVQAEDDDQGYYAYATTNFDGTYALRGLVPGLYRIEAKGGSRGYIKEYYDDQLSRDGANFVVVVGREAIGDVDFALSQGATISGRVTDGATGLPLVDVEVIAEDNNNDYRAYSHTNASGTYLLTGVAPGVYRIEARGKPQGYIEEYYDDQLNWDNADYVVVAGSEAIEGIDFGLKKGATISGRVTDGATGLPLVDIEISAHGEGSNGYQYSYTQTGADGRYTLSGVVPNFYRIEARGESKGYVEVSYDDLVDVSVIESVTGIDFGLNKGAIISGTVTAADTGLALANIEVRARNTEDNRQSDTTTGPDGRYQLIGMAAGTYRIYVRGDTGGYLRELYNGKLDWNEADVVTVVGANAVQAIDFALGRGGSISGRLIDADTGLPIRDINMRAERFGSGGSVAYHRTDADGRYTLNGIPPGFYVILARAREKGYVEEYYGGALDHIDADVITISGTQSVEGIDFSLHTGATISGRVSDAGTGLPIADMDVAARPIGGNDLSWSNTNSRGEYVLSGIPDGVIEVTVRGRGYIEVRKTVTIRDRQDVTDFDF